MFQRGDPGGRASVDQALALVPELSNAASAGDLIDRVQALGLRWGVSDGN